MPNTFLKPILILVSIGAVIVFFYQSFSRRAFEKSRDQLFALYPNAKILHSKKTDKIDKFLILGQTVKEVIFDNKGRNVAEEEFEILEKDKK